jgi:peptidoglycan/xylan/chitin deacetylase (PgdA/CDA1 family)
MQGNFSRRMLRPAVLLAALSMLAPGARADVGADARELIGNQRRILILRETATAREREEARRAGQYLFFRNQRVARRLTEEITHIPQEIPARYAELTRAMDDPAVGDEDRLALRNALETLSHGLPAAEQRDALQRLARLAELRRSLGEDFEPAFQRVPLSPRRNHSSRWEGYLASISRGVSASQILAEMDQDLVTAPEPAEGMSEGAARASLLEWNGEELPDKAVLLTFDDGPHPAHTAAILDILKKEGVHAVFFAVGRNLGEIEQGLVAVPGHNRALVARLIEEGHAIGNHSFTHPILPNLDARSIANEIAYTQSLIEAMVPAGPARTGGFRPPYGARNNKVLAQIDGHHLRSVVWNIDSEDWADPLPQSVAHRVVQEAERAGRGIVLMHDIHARSVEALPIVIRELRKRGFNFARWNGQRFVVDAAALRETPN